MSWKTILALLLALPILALFAGVGFLFWQIGQTWDARNTSNLITGLVVACSGGAIVLGILLALIIGVPLALRTYSEAARARREWHERPTLRPLYDPPTIAGQWRMLPPVMPANTLAHESPPWGATGGGNFDLLPPHSQRHFSDEEPTQPGL